MTTSWPRGAFPQLFSEMCRPRSPEPHFSIRIAVVTVGILTLTQILSLAAVIGLKSRAEQQAVIRPFARPESPASPAAPPAATARACPDKALTRGQLCCGLLRLQSDPRLRLRDAQREAIAVILHKMAVCESRGVPDTDRLAFEASQVLTIEQATAVQRAAVLSPQPRRGFELILEKTRTLKTMLERRARSAGGGTLAAHGVVLFRQPTQTLLAGLVALDEGDPATRLSAAQARRLLPTARALLKTVEEDHALQGKILQALSAPQQAIVRTVSAVNCSARAADPQEVLKALLAGG